MVTAENDLVKDKMILQQTFYSAVFQSRKKVEMNSNMVSIGIQNESGVQHNLGHAPKKKPRTKTIICMDNAIQTGGCEKAARKRDHDACIILISFTALLVSKSNGLSPAHRPHALN